MRWAPIPSASGLWTSGARPPHGLAIAVPEGGGQGVLAGFGEDHGAAVIVQGGEVNQAGRAVLLSGPSDNRPIRVKELIHDHRDAVAHILHICHGELQVANGQDL